MSRLAVCLLRDVTDIQSLFNNAVSFTKYIQLQVSCYMKNTDLRLAKILQVSPYTNYL
jgi:hypothetical protein